MNYLKPATKSKRNDNDTYHFSIGEIKNFYSLRSLKVKPDDFHYQPVRGSPKLLSQILKLKDVRNNISENQICLTVGAKQGIAIAFDLLKNTVTTVIIPNPGWPPYKMLATTNNLSIVFYDPAHATEIPSIVRNHPNSLLILNYPHNPTGSVINKDQLSKIVDACILNNSWILSDEVYVCLEPNHPSIIDFLAKYPRLIVVDSMSKSFAAAGLRLGYVFAPVDTINNFLDKIGISVSGTSSLSQSIAQNILSEPSLQKKIVRRVFNDRTRLADIITNAGYEIKSQGGPYLWVQGGPELYFHSKTILGLPGSVFGNPNFSRFCASSNPVGLCELEQYYRLKVSQ